MDGQVTLRGDCCLQRIGGGTLALERDGEIRLVRSPENRGFGAGCNLGVQNSTGRYLLFLNPDTRFLNDVLAELKQFLDSETSVGVAGPLVIDEDGCVLFSAGRSLPTLYNEFLQHSTLAFRFPKFGWNVTTVLIHLGPSLHTRS